MHRQRGDQGSTVKGRKWTSKNGRARYVLERDVL